jgi:hypothetical protein
MSRKKRIGIALLCAAPALASASGCARTVLVEEDTLLRVGRDARIRVWYRLDGEWRDSGTSLGIPEGWYLVPPSFVSEDDPLPRGPLP